MRVLAAAVAVSLLATATSCSKSPDPKSLLPPEGKYDVTIRRDTWGVPHIYGKTDADVAYGLAFAHCEDDFETLQQSFYLCRAKLGVTEGKEAAPFDFLVKLFKFREIVAEKYETDLSPEVRAICEAYADGCNHYAALNMDKMLDASVLPVTGQDVVAGFVIKTPMFFGMDGQLRRLMDESRTPEISEKQVAAWEGSFLTNDLPIGSNTFAVAPSRSADGGTYLNINSHQPLTGPVAWYEARLHSEEGWDIVGGVFPGTPVILHGHNRDLGWAHTVNSPDLIDIYALEVNPDNPNQYKLDGEWKNFELAELPLQVRIAGPLTWTVKREALYSEHGPAVRTSKGVFAVRYAGYGDIRLVEQWFRMNKAKNREEFVDALRMQALPSFNIGYGDREGNIGYVYNARLPKRAEGYDWEKYLPGHTSETLWTSYVPFDEIPQVWNPQTGFIQNCNGTPFKTTTGDENPREEDFSKTFGIETHLTNRGIRALELFGVDESISWDEFYAYKYDTKYSPESEAAELRKEILEKCPKEDPVIIRALELLESWDGDTNLENTSAAVAILAMEPVVRARMFGNPEPDPVALFQEKALEIHKIHGRVDVPWGEINRLVRGDKSLPVAGGPDTLRAVYGQWKDGKLHAEAGDCYVLMVRWEADGQVHSHSIHQFGSATMDPDSPHYADQMELFAREEMKPVWLEEAALRENLKEEYRPGQRAS